VAGRPAAWAVAAAAKAFSSEVDAGSREENASRQKTGASVLMQSEPMLQATNEIGASEAACADVQIDRCEIELARAEPDAGAEEFLRIESRIGRP